MIEQKSIPVLAEAMQTDNQLLGGHGMPDMTNILGSYGYIIEGGRKN